jgi:hypothetical protein
VLAFFRQIPQAILRSIIAHMKLTDPDELDRLVSSGSSPQHPTNNNNNYSSNSCNSDNNKNGKSDSNCRLQRRKTVPLTPARVDFLMSLLDIVRKPV